MTITETLPLITPAQLKEALPVDDGAAAFVAESRRQVRAVLEGRDRRLLAIVGPCSIHDPVAALEYAQRLQALRHRHADQLLILMRVYFEKPRTTVGWKGLINDPGLDGSHDVARGLRIARKLFIELAEMGVPAASEALDPVSPQYLSDLISWTAIGARTTESQTHREMASGLSMPVGFKNGTDGGLAVAANAMRAAQAPHSFMAIDDAGGVAIIRTRGNPDCHLVLRGGKDGPNSDPQAVATASKRLDATGLNPRVLVDCSHGNSGGSHHKQPAVLAGLAQQVASGADNILGFMLESHLVAGRQDLVAGKALTYGQSVTDACIDFHTTEVALSNFVNCVAPRKGMSDQAHVRLSMPTVSAL